MALASAAFVAIVSPGNPFYGSLRVGQGGRPITIYKIRTMQKNADKIGTGTTMANDPRFIFGARFLRITKLDEMPQFWSVLNGDLAIVGPRPELAQYVALYSETEKSIILSVRPGIVDYGTLAFPDLQAVIGSGDGAEQRFVEEFAAKKIELRLKYVQEQSFLTDLKILLATPVSILKTVAGKII
jgi:lipopolysaccharide/colanic/teichoic acid biosynthesis glycosyltransferase